MPIKPSGLLGADYKIRAKDILSSRFLLPPFTVLNTREGFWQERKRQWISLGIKSELGRGYTEEGTAYGTSLGKSGELNKKYRDASPGGSPRPAMNNKGRPYGAPIARGDGHGRTLVKPAPGGSPLPAALSYQTKAGLAEGRKLIRGDGASGQAPAADDEEPIGGTSVFDPVLCELAYRWFCPAGGTILDPFAGGSVRGIVAGELGYSYIGMDLSEVQVAANIKQAKELGTDPKPTWICGDSINISKRVGVGNYDFLFTCPPYGNLEVYSQDPRDISNMALADFNLQYAAIIKESVALLKPNSMACVVVGDYRDAAGMYCNLPGVTIQAFADAGMALYNEAILVNVTGSLPLRINKQFNGSRKLGRCHQTVLVFTKGQPKEYVPTWPKMEIGT